MEYRKAEVSDIPHLMELRKRQLMDEGQSGIVNIDRELADFFTCAFADNSLVFWLAIDGGQIVSTGGVCFYRYPPHFYNPTGHIAYITTIFTEKEYRRQGLASAVLKLVLDEAKARGCKIARLHASSDGKPLYQKFGFVDSEGHMSLEL